MTNIRLPHHELQFTYSRSSGAGGQHINKTNTKATLEWDPRSSSVLNAVELERFLRIFYSKITADGRVQISSQRFREQGANARDCIEKLVEMIKTAKQKPKKRIATKPTRSSQRRRLETKSINSEKKQSRRERF
jgi:ribosome-associated protein